MTVFSIFTLQKFTNFHAIRSWSFRNINNEIGWPVAPFLLRHPVSISGLSGHIAISRCLSLLLSFGDTFLDVAVVGKLDFVT